jgi:hypothetical protein
MYVSCVILLCMCLASSFYVCVLRHPFMLHTTTHSCLSFFSFFNTHIYQNTTSYVNRVEVTAFQASRGHSTDGGSAPNCNCAGNTFLADSLASAISAGADLNKPGSFGIIANKNKRRQFSCPVTNLPVTWLVVEMEVVEVVVVVIHHHHHHHHQFRSLVSNTTLGRTLFKYIDPPLTNR